MISVVIPAYKSQLTLPVLIPRLYEVLTKIASDFEVIIIDDGSPDNTWQVMKELKQMNKNLKIVRLLKNSGQHNAILCGLGLANGEIVVTMDDDLQNSPEDIPKLVKAIHDGYDLAIASYDQKNHSPLRNLGGQCIDYVQRHIFNMPKTFQLTSFRAIRKVVVDHAVNMRAIYPYITSMLLSHTSKYVNVPVKHQPRLLGSSSYSARKSLILALNLLLNYSSYPLYVVVFICLSALIFSMLLGSWVIWKVLAVGVTVPGWASTIAGISFFNSLILFGLVIQSLYLSRMSQQLTRSRTSFAIGEVHE